MLLRCVLFLLSLMYTHAYNSTYQNDRDEYKIHVCSTDVKYRESIEFQDSFVSDIADEFSLSPDKIYVIGVGNYEENISIDFVIYTSTLLIEDDSEDPLTLPHGKLTRCYVRDDIADYKTIKFFK